MVERLLPSKLHCPSVRSDFVPRLRLNQIFAGTLERDRRLTLVSAPAGYGKSTAVAAWLGSAEFSKRSCSTAWLTLDKGDNDPVRFATYLVAALGSIDGRLGESGAEVLSQGQPLSLQTLISTVIADSLDQGAEVDATPQRADIVLVLDDYHVIRSVAIHDAITFLIENLPPTWRLIAVSREDPPWPLSRLRVNGQLVEVRAHDLRFSPHEALAFFRATLQVDLPEATVAAMERKTEGWVAGLQLAALALHGAAQEFGEIDRFVADFSGSHRFVVDYLVDEVLKRQPATTADFLRCTALLDRFNADLCDAVTGRDDSQAALESLERTNLFLVPLDTTRTWYRYHHLFADVLRTELTVEPARTVHRRAAEWLVEHELFEEAIDHWLSATDHAAAAELIARQSADLLRRGEVMTLLQWLDALPPASIERDAYLLVLHILVLFLSGDGDSARARLAAVESKNSAMTTSAADARLTAIRAWMEMTDAGDATIEMAERALTQLGDDPFYAAFAAIALGTGRAAHDDLVGSTAAFETAYRMARQSGQSLAAMGALANIAFNLINQGDLRRAQARCQNTLAEHTDARGRVQPVACLALMPMGTIAYLNDRLDVAEQYAKQALALATGVLSNAVAGGDAQQVLAEVAWAQGDYADAIEQVDATLQTARDHNVPVVVYRMNLLAATFYIRLGDLAAAEVHIAAARRLDLPASSTIERMASGVQARLLILQEEPEAAIELLAPLEGRLHAAGAHGRRLALHILQSLAHADADNVDEAQHYLTAALKIAAPQGYQRLFLVEGEPIALPAGRCSQHSVSLRRRSPARFGNTLHIPDRHDTDHRPSSAARPVPHASYRIPQRTRT